MQYVTFTRNAVYDTHHKMSIRLLLLVYQNLIMNSFDTVILCTYLACGSDFLRKVIYHLWLGQTRDVFHYVYFIGTSRSCFRFTQNFSICNQINRCVLCRSIFQSVFDLLQINDTYCDIFAAVFTQTPYIYGFITWADWIILHQN